MQSPKKDKRRTSILKKQKSYYAEEEDQTEVTISRVLKKTQFSQKNQVKEFMACSESVTIWGNTYETSVAKSSDGSSCNDMSSGAMHKTGLSFLHQTTSTSTIGGSITHGSEKENVIIQGVHNQLESNSVPSSSTAEENLNSTRPSTEFSVYIDPSEMKRINRYGSENLNITSLAFDQSTSAPSSRLSALIAEEGKVLSPRKMIFHNNSNVLVSVQDKVYLKPSDIGDNVSISFGNLESFEDLPAHSKQIVQQNDTKPTFVAPTLPPSRSEKSVAMQYCSPPKHGKETVLDDIFKSLVSDTPSKNLCCLGKGCTPTRSATKVVFSAKRPESAPRKSINLLEEFEMIEKDKVKTTATRKTVFQPTPMQIEKPLSLQPNLRSSRKTIVFNDSIKIEADAKDEAIKDFNSRQTINVPELIESEEHHRKSVGNASVTNATQMNLEQIMNEDTNNDTENFLKAVKRNSGKSFVSNDSIDIDDTEELGKFKIDEKPAAARKTLFDSSPMQIDEPALVKPSLETRKTIVFDDSMQVEADARKIQKHKSRPTVNIPEVIEIEDHQQKSLANVSVANATEMNLEQIVNEDTNNDTENFLKALRRNSRKSFVSNDSIDIDDSLKLEDFKLNENPTAPRKTLFDASPMQIEKPSTAQASLENRKTIVSNDFMQIEADAHVAAIPKYKSRLTVNVPVSIEDEDYEQKAISNRSVTNSTQMNVEKKAYEDTDNDTENFLNVVKRLSKKSIVPNDSIDLDEIGELEEFKLNEKQAASRKTLFDSSPMQIEKPSRAPPSVGTRKTIVLNESMQVESDETFHQVEPNERKSLHKNMHKTIAADSNIALEELDMNQKKSQRASRRTVFDPSPMQVENPSSVRTNMHSRKTMAFNESIQVEEKETVPEIQAKSRKTIHQPESIEIETNHLHCRKTFVKNDSICIDDEAKVEILKTDGRKTLYDPQNMETEERHRSTMNETNSHDEIIGIESNLQNVPLEVETKHTHGYSRKTFVKNDSICIDEEPEYKIRKTDYRKTVCKSQNMETEEPHRSLLSATNVHDEIIEIESNPPTIPQIVTTSEMEEDISSCYHHKGWRKTFVKNESMRLEDEDVTEPDLLRDASKFTISQYRLRPTIDGIQPIENDRRLTYTKNESIRWHNLTDKEMSNMIDDESNPCVSSFEQPTSRRSSSELSALPIYVNAVEDFVNLTIMESPLNETVSRNRSMKQIEMRRQSRVPSPVKDYEKMFDDLVCKLKKKDQPKPQMEIDEYLEKMNVKPVKIPRNLLNDSASFVAKMNGMFEDHRAKRERNLRLRKETEEQSFPQIPSAKFLMKNLIECIEECILEKIRMEQTVAPVFPESVDFINLLYNKFKSDEMLSKYWHLDTIFWWMKSFKLTHWKMPMFTLNFNCQQSNEEVNESSIPIIFRDVCLYLNAEYRKSANFSERNLLLRNEFKKAINIMDNFTSVCSSSRELFAFLNYYHECVMRTVNLVDNFLNVVLKYDAVYTTYFSSIMIKKMCFFEEKNREIVEIKIMIDGYIEDVSVNDLNIKGWRSSYSLHPRASLNEMKGLMLIELVLYDTERFLQDHTIQVPKTTALKS